MKRIILASTLTVAAMSGTTGFAASPFTSTAICHAQVVKACGTAGHPGACSVAGIKACDDILAAGDIQLEGLYIKIEKVGAKRYKASFPGQKSIPTRRYTDDGDDNRESGGSSSSGDGSLGEPTPDAPAFDAPDVIEATPVDPTPAFDGPDNIQS